MNKEMLQELGIDIEDIRGQVIQDAARIVADNMGRDVRSELTKVIQNLVNEKINEVIEEVLSEKFQPVNTFGKKIGEPTTIRDIFEESVQKWWDVKVDNNGKVSTGYGTKQTRAEYFAKEMVGKYVDTNLRSEMTKIVDAGKDQVRQAMATAIDQLIKNYWK